MIIGIPKEIKDKEFRVGMVPSGVKSITLAGGKVLVERGAGIGSDIKDEEYTAAGAEIVESAAELFSRSDMIVKVKEPLPAEYDFLKEGMILYTFLHLAPLPELTDVLVSKGVTAIGYETVQLENGYLPLLAPMSEVAGRMSVQVGAHFLEKEEGGRGVLLGGVPGVERGHITILGGGIAGGNAARVAAALGANVTLLDIDLHRLACLDDLFAGRVNTLISNAHNIEEQIKRADVLIGAVLIPGSRAPKLVTKEMLSIMKKGAVIVDIAIDQGGCVESSIPTTHSDPVFKAGGVVHYCVTNMPGAVSRTSTFALTNATAPFVLDIAKDGLEKTLSQNRALKRGVNTYMGKLVNKEVAKSQNKKWENL